MCLLLICPSRSRRRPRLLGRQGSLVTRGLPVCRARRLPCERVPFSSLLSWKYRLKLSRRASEGTRTRRRALPWPQQVRRDERACTTAQWGRLEPDQVHGALSPLHRSTKRADVTCGRRRRSSTSLLAATSPSRSAKSSFSRSFLPQTLRHSPHPPPQPSTRRPTRRARARWSRR